MQLSIHETEDKAEVMAWVPMTNPPKKSGHYAVMHRGRVFGTAYFYAGDFKTNLEIGWNQLPHFGPTHWLDSSYNVADVEKRFWPQPKLTKKQPAKQSWWTRIWK